MFAELNTAFAAPIVVRVPAGVVVTEPIVVRTTGPRSTASAVFPRLVVEAGADSEVTVVERYHAPTDVRRPRRAGHRARGRAGRPAALPRRQRARARVWQIGSPGGRVGQRDSTTLLATVGARRRLRPGPHRLPPRRQAPPATCSPLYFGEADQMHDFRTFQDHAAPDTTANLLFKGAVAGPRPVASTPGSSGSARRPGAPTPSRPTATSSCPTSAWAESRAQPRDRDQRRALQPRLTVGPIDEEQRFYLESRGVPPEVAERLIVLGFFDEVLERLPVAGAAWPTCAPRSPTKLDRTPEDLPMSAVDRCARLDDAAPTATARRFDVDGHRVAVVRIGDDVYAIGDTLQPRRRLAVARARSTPTTREIECWKHGSSFSLVDRRARRAAGHPAVPVYDVAVVDGDVVHRLTRLEPMSELRDRRPAGRRRRQGDPAGDRPRRCAPARSTPSWGRTASGKSTLSHVIMGRPGYEVLGGSVTLDGVDVLALPHVGAGPGRAVPRHAVPDRGARRVASTTC